ncbi:ROK family protein [Arthrobacter sp. NQ7]|uniref:ROK family protein n=1 Tax=Arthrobacter sp. NQ7 TaxID=3032303 RepID=UPI00240F2627|nr:ROK family protein [Arthrobacter sp. NQ7]MDJ0459303.1 ROK family protein [Arthrobacter sp. NQ7]
MNGSTPAQLAVGIDVGGTKLKVCAATLDGRILAISEARGPAGRHTTRVLKDVQACFTNVLDRAAALLGRDVIAGAVGLVTPGVIGENGIALTPNNPGMETSLPAETIAAMLGVGSVAWANDVKAAAMADHQWGELQGARCGLYINLGTGLSAGAVIDGKPLMGANGAALEIGYLLPVSASHTRGHRSGSAPLEDAVSGRALGDRALASTGESATASEILGAWAKNPGSGTVLSELGAEFVDELIHMASNLAITLDPDIISIGGGVTAAAEVFMPRLRDALDEFVPYPPVVAVSPMAGDLSMLGALFIAYQSLEAPVPSLCLPLPATAHNLDETLRMPEPSRAGA